MTKHSLPVTFLLLFLVLPLAAQDRVPADVLTRLSLTDGRLLQLDTRARPGQPFALPVEIDGVEHLLELWPASVRADGFEVRAQLADGSWAWVDPGVPRTFRGSVAGLDGSDVAASLLDDGWQARIRLGMGDEHWVEPLPAGVATDGGNHVLYRAEDALVDPRNRCGLETGRSSNQGGSVLAGAGFVHVTELGCDADFQYHNAKGGLNGAQNAIESVINTMNLQYESEVAITHEITTILVRTSANQPYTSTNPSNLLQQFQFEWNFNQGGIQRDVAELFTGKNLDGSVIGVAYLGTICTNGGYNLVQNISPFSYATDLSAHELGHNWDAGHCTCPSNTMNPFITGANTFNVALTRPSIEGHRDSRNCLYKAYDGTKLFTDGFESGDFSAGWAVATGAKVKGGAARHGDFGARLKKTTSMEIAVDTTGFSEVAIEFDHRSKQYEAGEVLTVEWWDGLAWNPVAEYSQGTWRYRLLVLPALAANNPSFKLRFRTNAVGKNTSTGKKKKSDVDRVRVHGN